VALGSLIIAIIQFARAVVLYMEAHTKGKPPNALQKAIFCIISCWLRCLEFCMDKINKNALIWTAIYGDSFATACCSSFMMIWRNLARVAAINIVADVLLGLTKLTVALGTTGVCALILTRNSYYVDNLSSPLVPAIVIFCISYTVGSLFVVIFHAVTDTIFFCFLVDEEVNGKRGAPMLAAPGLAKLVGQYKKQSEEEAAEQQTIRKERPGATVVPETVAVRPSPKNSGTGAYAQMDVKAR